MERPAPAEQIQYGSADGTCPFVKDRVFPGAAGRIMPERHRAFKIQECTVHPAGRKQLLLHIFLIGHSGCLCHHAGQQPVIHIGIHIALPRRKLQRAAADQVQQLCLRMLLQLKQICLRHVGKLSQRKGHRPEIPAHTGAHIEKMLKRDALSPGIFRIIVGDGIGQRELPFGGQLQYRGRGKLLADRAHGKYRIQRIGRSVFVRVAKGPGIEDLIPLRRQNGAAKAQLSRQLFDLPAQRFLPLRHKAALRFLLPKGLCNVFFHSVPRFCKDQKTYPNCQRGQHSQCRRQQTTAPVHSRNFSFRSTSK